MKYEDDRKETPFATRDNMLNIRQHLEELCRRGFGIRKRKEPKTPRNFSEWSEVSQARWKESVAFNLQWQEQCDRDFIEDETKWIRATCREILELIAEGNRMNPQTEHECDIQRDMQNTALQKCDMLRRELNFIADTLPCNKNFLVLQDKDLDKEMALIRGWRKSCNPIRETAIRKDAMRSLKGEEWARAEIAKAEEQ